MSPLSPLDAVTALLAPLDEHTPYTIDRARDRARDLLGLYADAAADREIAAHLVERAQRSFWAHLALFGWTTDSLSELHRKPFNPAFYVRLISDWADERTDDGRWVRPTLLFPKSRQVMMSWWAMARLDWAAQRFPGSEIPVVAKNEENAKRILRRIRDLHDGLDAFAPWYRRESGALPAKRRSKAPSETRIDYGNGSYVVALAEGGEQVRSMVAPLQLYDEAAFQPHFRDNLGAALAFRGRAQVLCVSSANPSHFAEMTHDRQDGRVGGVESEFYRSGVTFPASGSNEPAMRLWRTRAYGVDVAKVFYFADPAYRTPEAVTARKAGKTLDQYRREDLIDDEARVGRRVFPQLDAGVHVMRRAPWLRRVDGRWLIHTPGHLDATGEPAVRPCRLLRAIDHGTTNFCGAIWVAVDADGDWTVIREYKRSGRGAADNAFAIDEASEELASGLDAYSLDVIDAMLGMPDGRGTVERLYKFWERPDGTKPFIRLVPVRKGAGSRQEGLDAIGSMLLSTLARDQPDGEWWTKEGYTDAHRDSFKRRPAIYISPACPLLIREMDMARYDERPGGDPTMAQPETTLDMMDELIDCLRYLIRAWNDRPAAIG